MFSISWSVLAVILFISFFLIGKSADVLIRSLVNLGKIFHVKEFSLGFVLLGLATSLPELLIGIYSVVGNIPKLAFGNLIGGMIVLLTLVIGFNALLFGKIAVAGNFGRYSLCKIIPRVPVCHRFSIHDTGLIGALLIMPVLLLIDGTLSRLDGLILIVFYLFQAWYYIHEQREQDIPNGQNLSLGRNLLLFSISAVILVILTRVIVGASETILARFNIPPFIFGFLILGVGTNLPELVVMLRAGKFHHDISVGNILGSAVANVFILGLLVLASPLTQLLNAWIVSGAIMLVVAVLAGLILLRTKDELSRFEAVFLVALYIVFITIQGFMR